jgi:hypothetical protein
MSESKPVFDYLQTCSQQSLESFELSRLSQVANLRKELRDVVAEWVEAEVQARLARWLLERWRTREQVLIPFPDPLAEPIDDARPEHRSLLRAGKGPVRLPARACAQDGG